MSKLFYDVCLKIAAFLSGVNMEDLNWDDVERLALVNDYVVIVLKALCIVTVGAIIIKLIKNSVALHKLKKQNEVAKIES